MSVTKGWFFTRVGKARIIPMYVKIVAIFVFFLLVSNFTTNFINLMMNRNEQVRLLGDLLSKDLKELYVYSSNQYEIFLFEQNLDASKESLVKAGERSLRLDHAAAFGIEPSGSFLFASIKDTPATEFTDKVFLDQMNELRSKGIEEGEANFIWNGMKYFGYYRYNSSWNVYIVRAEEENAFYAESWNIFRTIVIIIVILTLVAMWVGIYLIRRILRYISVITQRLMEMQSNQELGMIDLPNAPNDDITYLGISFNSLSSTIKNLMNIFKKFVTKDVVQSAYKDRSVTLAGTRKELTILFTDIKGFTYMTETLGTDIIKLLNLHYDKAIRLIQYQDGIVGSIIGDALLAVFGSLEGGEIQRSLKAVRAAYSIQQVAEQLRKKMHDKKAELLEEKGSLTSGEESVFKAVLLEIGVGIDGGDVFYGRIGSYVHMTNTVIGDNVNSASRLEGLTRVYKVSVIVSDFVKLDVERDSPGEFIFQELDMVQVKGKTTGKKIFWPVPIAMYTPELKEKLSIFDEALQLYYEGEWRKAVTRFAKVELPMADVFIERIKSAGKPPLGWSGLWTMTTK